MFGDKVEHYFGRFLLLTSVMGLNEAAGAAVEGSRSTRFLSERIVGVKAQPFRQEVFRWLRSALFAAA